MENAQNVRRVISVLVENESSVLSRISGLFAGRGYNIEVQHRDFNCSSCS